MTDNFYKNLPENFNLTNYLLDLNKDRKDKAAFIYGNKNITFEEVAYSTKQAAGLLKSFNLEREQRLAIILPNIPEFVSVFLGTLWIGAIAIPLHPELSEKDIVFILQDCRAKVVLTTSALKNKLAKYSSLPAKTILSIEEFSFLLKKAIPVSEPEKTSKDEQAFWLYTSGTTGKPKGVMHLHHDAALIAESYAVKTLQLTENDILYSIASLAFAYGLGNSLYMPMRIGATSILSDKDGIFELIDSINQNKATVFFGIPSIFNALLKLHKLNTFDIPSIRFCVSAAEPLPVLISQEWKKHFHIEIIDGIGATEVSHIFISNRPDEFRYGSIGKPIPGFGVTVKNDDGEILSKGEIGNLWVQGETLMLGYWNRHLATQSVLKGDTFCTGDIVYYDEDGFFWYVGRKDDLIKVQGRWVSPLEIEEVLLKHPSIAEAAVSIHLIEDGLNAIKAYVVLNPNKAESKQLVEDILAFLRSQLPSYKIPKQIYFLPNLPHTVNGKIQRKVLSKIDSI